MNMPEINEGAGAAGAAPNPRDAKAVSPASLHSAIEHLPPDRGSSVDASGPDGAELLDRCLAFVNRFVSWPTENAGFSVILWAAHAHLMDAWETTPRLVFLSAEPGSGKSRAMSMTALLCPLALESANASTASLVRAIGDPAGRPTFFVDEIDTKYGPNAKGDEEFRSMLNAGFHSDGTFLRSEKKRGEQWVPVRLPAYAAVAMAGIGNILHDTILTRSVVVRMLKSAPGEKRAEPYRKRDHQHLGQALCDELAVWADRVRQQAVACRPVLPDGVEDRNADVWEPLIVIADLAGGQWPDRARAAAVEAIRSAKANQRPSIGIQLLIDIRSCFTEDKISSAALTERLRAIEESPWCERKLDPYSLAKMLDEYGIKSKTIRFNGSDASILRGYARADFIEVWSRLLPPVEPDVTSATSATDD